MISITTFTRQCLVASLLFGSIASQANGLLEEALFPVTGGQPQLIPAQDGAFAVYVWGEQCGECKSHLSDVNTTTPVISVFVPRVSSKETSSALSLEAKRNKAQSQIKQISAPIQHYFSPYGSLSDQPYYQVLPQVRIYNQFKQLAAIYPNFDGDWQPVQELISKLYTNEFANYSIEDKTTQELLTQTRRSVASRRQVRIDSATAQMAPQEVITVGPKPLPATMSRLALKAPKAAFGLINTKGMDTDGNLSGFNAALVFELNETQNGLISFKKLSASDHGEELVAPNTPKPELSHLRLGIEGVSRSVLYEIAGFITRSDYRDDQGFDFDVSHEFWQNLQIRVGTTVFSSSHDEFVTVQRKEDDTNRRHRLGFSAPIGTGILSIDWLQSTLQGVIENPNELVEFGFPGTTGTQYALYPSTRTENAYTLAWHKDNLQAGYTTFDDTWGREQHTLYGKVNGEWRDFEFSTTLSATHQNEAKLFSDLFPVADSQTLFSRSPHLAGFDRIAAGVDGRYELGNQDRGFALAGRSTFFTFGAHVGYYDFDTLTTGRENPRLPVSNVVISTAVGIEVSL